MHKATRAEKDFVRYWVDYYVRAGGELTLREYSRLLTWLNGDSFRTIAENEGVSAQAVGKSVRRAMKIVQDYGQREIKQTLDSTTN